jgi:hypothetical protein
MLVAFEALASADHIIGCGGSAGDRHIIVDGERAVDRDGTVDGCAAGGGGAIVAVPPAGSVTARACAA